VGKTEGTRSRGKSRCRFKDDIKWCVMGSSGLGTSDGLFRAQSL
jgi:hypothetical protein